MTALDELIQAIPPFLTALTALLSAIAVYLASRNSKKIDQAAVDRAATSAKVDSIDTMQTVQALATVPENAVSPVALADYARPYIKMSDESKKFLLAELNPQEQEAALAQIKAAESQQARSFLVILPGRGFVWIENGQIRGDAVRWK